MLRVVLSARACAATRFSRSVFPKRDLNWLHHPASIPMSGAHAHLDAAAPTSVRTFASASADGPTAAAPSSTPAPPAPSLKKTKIAVAQMTSTGDMDANFATCARLAEDAAAAGAAIAFFPECFNFLGTSPAEALAAAQPLDGPIIARYAALARRLRLWLSLGGFQESRPNADASRLFNSHVIIDAEGHVAATYRKIHLFDVDVPNGPILMESRFTAPGTGLVAIDSPAGRLGLSTCYDLRFPALYQRLTHDLGAEILLVPSAFTVATGEAHWEVLLRARAIETQCYVVAAAQAGRHNEKRESYGHSMIVDPWGRVVAALDDPLATGVATAEVDLGDLQRIRERMPIKQHRLAGQAAVETDLV